MVDRELKIRVWNARSADLWGVADDEARGQPLLDLHIDLPRGSLARPLRSCLGGERPEALSFDGHDRRGRAIQGRVHCHPLAGPGGEVDGVIVLVEVDA